MDVISECLLTSGRAGAYLEYSIVYSPLPCVMPLNSDEIPNIWKVNVKRSKLPS